MAQRKPGTKATQKSARSTTATKKRYDGFTDEEKGAMKDRVQEQKAAADEAAGEGAVLAKIAELPEQDRALGKRLHTIIKASAPALARSEEHTSELQSRSDLVCRLLLEKKKKLKSPPPNTSEKIKYELIFSILLFLFSPNFIFFFSFFF